MLVYGRLPIEDIQLIAHWEMMANKSIKAFEIHNGVEIETWPPKSPYYKFGKMIEKMADEMQKFFHLLFCLADNGGVEAMKTYGKP